MSDPLWEALDDHLPARVVVGQNGAYWRDFTDDPDHPGYSMCPVSTDNDPVEPIAVYVRLAAPEAGLREEPWRPLDGHNHDGEGYPTFPVFRVACPQGCDAASAPLPDGRPRSVVIDPLDPRLLRSIGVPPSVADAADASSRLATPPPEAGLREAADPNAHAARPLTSTERRIRDALDHYETCPAIASPADPLRKVRVWPGDPGYHTREECDGGYKPHVHLRASEAIVYSGHSLASPADPPSEPAGKSTANDAKVSHDDPPSDLPSEHGRLLAERDRLIAAGADPDDLLVPERPR